MNYYLLPWSALMDIEKLKLLEKKVNDLLGAHAARKNENQRLWDENNRLLEERKLAKDLIDVILKKLEGI